MTSYLQQKIIKKAGKIGEILKFTFSTGLPEENALLFLVLYWLNYGAWDYERENKIIQCSVLYCCISSSGNMKVLYRATKLL